MTAIQHFLRKNQSKESSAEIHYLMRFQRGPQGTFLQTRVGWSNEALAIGDFRFKISDLMAQRFQSD
jgi:hypothetical protein